MAKEKVERNKLIIKLYNQGKNDKEILAGLLKADFQDYQKVKSVTMQISRLRAAGKVPNKRPLINQIPKREVDKSRSPQVQTSRTRQVDKSIKLQDKSIGKYKPVTFRISEETEWQLKTLAVSRREKLSELVREIFNDYLSRNR